MTHKIKELEFIAEEASIAVLALSSSVFEEHDGVIALQKRMAKVSAKARSLIESETMEMSLNGLKEAS